MKETVRGYRHWTAAEDRLFRRFSNKEIARRTGRTAISVQSRKQTLRNAGVDLPYLLKVRRTKWTPEKDKIVAEQPPQVAMKLLDVSRAIIDRRRKALGLGRWVRPKQPKILKRPASIPWTEEEDRLVLTLPPGEAMRALGRRTRMAVHLRRSTLRRKGLRPKFTGR
jgi:hypothetical protein